MFLLSEVCVIELQDGVWSISNSMTENASLINVTISDP